MKKVTLSSLVLVGLSWLGSTSFSQDGNQTTDLGNCVKRWQLLKKEVRESLGPMRKPVYAIRILTSCNSANAATAESLPQLPKQLILVLGGLQSDSESAIKFAEALERSLPAPADTRLSVFDYPNDGSIQESGEALRKLLLEIRSRSPKTKVSIVAHSMGGLVARYAIETESCVEEPHLRDTVDHLAMICPPNHGSVLAQYSDALELGDVVSRMQRKNESLTSIVESLIDDGLGEACEDLMPGSDFLGKLNTCMRARGVRYTIYAGTRGPISPVLRLVGSLAIGEGRSQLRNSTGAVDDVLLRLEELVSSDELTDGLGDGAVSLRSARLEGVNEFVRVPIHHLEWTEIQQPNVQKLLQRLALDLQSERK
jgi:hypothetical protein